MPRATNTDWISVIRASPMISKLTIREEPSQVSNHVKIKSMYSGDVEGGQSVGTCHTHDGASSRAPYIQHYIQLGLSNKNGAFQFYYCTFILEEPKS